MEICQDESYRKHGDALQYFRTAMKKFNSQEDDTGTDQSPNQGEGKGGAVKKQKQTIKSEIRDLRVPDFEGNRGSYYGNGGGNRRNGGNRGGSYGAAGNNRRRVNDRYDHHRSKRRFEPKVEEEEEVGVTTDVNNGSYSKSGDALEYLRSALKKFKEEEENQDQQQQQQGVDAPEEARQAKEPKKEKRSKVVKMDASVNGEVGSANNLIENGDQEQRRNRNGEHRKKRPERNNSKAKADPVKVWVAAVSEPTPPPPNMLDVDDGEGVDDSLMVSAAAAATNGGQIGNKKEHSIKVPRLYKEASKGLASIVEQGYGLKSALYTRKHPNIKGITALVTESIRHTNQLDYLIQKSKILEEEPNLNKHLAKILITELLWGKKRLGSEAKPVLTVLKYEPKFYKVLERYERKNRKPKQQGREQQTTDMKSESTDSRAHLNVKPRYVRVNTLKTTLEAAISQFTSDGWTQIDEPPPLEDLNLKEWSLAHPDGFYLDSFVPNLLVFPIGTQFQSHPLYLEGAIILQDKASCLPPLALKPRKGRTILDSCAAPGMKTSFLAAMVDKESKIFAIEKAQKRFATLSQMMELYGANTADKHCVHAIRNDFTNINPEDTEYKETEYILVDPSCSGSGMTGRVEVDLQWAQSSAEAESLQQADRLYALSYCQTKLLCHAMKFPNVKRIVYSTCSVYPEENEDVVAAALDYNNNGGSSAGNEEGGDGNGGQQGQGQGGGKNIFRVKMALPDWPHRSKNPNYEWSSKCLISSLRDAGTDGFFVAVLEKVNVKSRNY